RRRCSARRRRDGAALTERLGCRLGERHAPAGDLRPRSRDVFAQETLADLVRLSRGAAWRRSTPSSRAIDTELSWPWLRRALPWKTPPPERSAMTRLLIRIAALVTASLVTASLVTVIAAPQAQPPSFISGARTVAVYATVANAQGRLVPDLSRDDFAIDDNGKRQDLTVFSNDLQPITLIMLLDRSSSMKPNFDLEERAA